MDSAICPIFTSTKRSGHSEDALCFLKDVSTRITERINKKIFTPNGKERAEKASDPEGAGRSIICWNITALNKSSPIPIEKSVLFFIKSP